jgi:serine/threonine protein kinase
MSILYEEDTDCIECDRPRPELGWGLLENVSDPFLGRVLENRYIVSRFIGAGTSGNVYRLESLTIPRSFAIKIVAIPEDGREHADRVGHRLEQEIEALSRLRTPHIVRVFEVLDLVPNFVGIVMDYVEGVTLRSLVNQSGPLEPDRAIAIMRQVVNGIHEAHEIGMIHRDLKPANILIERMPLGQEFPFILDFGLVYLTDSVHRSHGFIGTPMYASPEQAQAWAVDRRSDIYSLGAMFCFLLTGRPPFVGETSYEILVQHVNSEPPTLTKLADKRLFSDELEELVGSMLAKRPEDRPQDLAEVLRTLDDLPAQGHVQTSFPGTVTDPTLVRPPAPEEGPESTQVDARPFSCNEFQENPGGAPGTEDTSAVPGASHVDVRMPVLAPNLTPQEPPEASERDSEAAMSAAHAAMGSGERRMSDLFPQAAIMRTTPPPDTQPAYSEELVESSRPALGRALVAPTWLGLVPSSGMAHCRVTAERRTVLVDDSHSVWLLDESAQETIEVLYRSKQPVRALAAHADFALIGLYNGSVERIDLATGIGRRIFGEPLGSNVTAIAMDPEASLLVWGSRKGRVSYGRVHGGRRGHLDLEGAIECAAVNSQGTAFAIAHSGGDVELFDYTSPSLTSNATYVDKPVQALAFSEDGFILAIVFKGESSVHLHHLPTLQRLMSFDCPGRLLDVRFGEGSELLVLAQIEDWLLCWDIEQ